jgi:hypothetical protein
MQHPIRSDWITDAALTQDLSRNFIQPDDSV